MALTEEALRLYERYQREFVEALGICPWATRARREGRVRPEVVLDADPGVEPVVDTVRRLGDDPRVDVGLLLFPRVEWPRPRFERFVSDVREADARRGPVVMALAEFHPHAPADPATGPRLVPFLRRTPDPTIQLVRRTLLERVRAGESHGTGFISPAVLDSLKLTEESRAPLHERVAEANLQTVQQRGLDRVQALLDDIRRDREATYARLDR